MDSAQSVKSEGVPMQKTCSKCQVSFPLDLYCKHSTTKDGLSPWCKTCRSEYNRRWKEDNPERVRELDRRYHKKHRDAKRERNRKRRLDPSTPDYPNSEYQERWRRNNPEKVRAKKAVARALKSGKLVRPSTCSRCHATGNIEGHHWSYEKEHWLDVEWVCRSCHVEHHVKLREEQCYQSKQTP